MSADMKQIFISVLFQLYFSCVGSYMNGYANEPESILKKHFQYTASISELFHLFCYSLVLVVPILAFYT